MRCEIAGVGAKHEHVAGKVETSRADEDFSAVVERRRHAEPANAQRHGFIAGDVTQELEGAEVHERPWRV